MSPAHCSLLQLEESHSLASLCYLTAKVIIWCSLGCSKAPWEIRSATKISQGLLTKDPIWGIGSWLLISPALVSEPPQCLSCFWSGRPLLSSCWRLAHLPFRPDPFNVGGTSWARADLQRKEEAGTPELPRKCFLHAVMVTVQKEEQRKLCIWRSLPCSDSNPFCYSSKHGLRPLCGCSTAA